MSRRWRREGVKEIVPLMFTELCRRALLWCAFLREIKTDLP